MKIGCDRCGYRGNIDSATPREDISKKHDEKGYVVGGIPRTGPVIRK